MTGISILSSFAALHRPFRASGRLKKPDLHTSWLHPERLPTFVRESPIALRYLDLLGPLDWTHLPERNLLRDWGQPAISYAAFLAAYLIKLEDGRDSMGDLRQYLVEHPALIWLLGFPLVVSNRQPLSFDPQASLPTERHLARMLRKVPNHILQFLLNESVRLLKAEFASRGIQVGECISLDTKHILAWVKENNPKAYVENRFDKTQQPRGDPDCKLGCKRRHNQRTSKSEPQKFGGEPLPTPTTNPLPADTIQVGDFYWGYGSGVVVAKVQNEGEFVLAEMTQPFNQSDVTYFFPLMHQTEQRLGFKPRFGTFDAAFDAWYVYDYFHRDDDPQAFAAVPFSEKGGYKAKGRQFSPQGLPLCAAGFPMPLQITYTDHTTCIIEHERGRYVCPLFFPQPAAQPCPVNHKNYAKKGCTAMMPTSIGARLRYTLDRDSQTHKDIYRQRTAVERINSQAVDLGIERPHLRNGSAIANSNTLIYTLINLRLLHRLHQRHPSSG
jgi:hypothetical protein